MRVLSDPNKLGRFLLWLIFSFIAGCAGTSLSVRFYTLAPFTGSPPPEFKSILSHDKIVGIGPVEIPELLNRPQIITTQGNNRIDISESHRWGGALEEEILYQMTENLSHLLRSNRIVPFPWDAIPEPDIKISVKVHRFEGTLGEKAMLGATWSMTRPKIQAAPLIQRTLLETPVEDDSYQAYVSAQSRLLGILCREIASEVLKSEPK